MAPNPPKENGFTRFPNEILEALAKLNLPNYEMRCLLYVVRKTYGYHKGNGATISLRQFYQATGIKTKHVSRALKNLTEKNIVKVCKGTPSSGSTPPNKYRINSLLHEWRDTPSPGTPSSGTPSSGNKVLPDEGQASNIKKIKDNIPHFKNAEGSEDENQAIYLTKKRKKLTGKRLETFERFWAAFNYKKDKASAADAWLEIPSLTDQLVNEICLAAENEAQTRPDKIAKRLTPIYPQGWISGRRWEDEEHNPIKPEKQYCGMK